MGLSGSKKTTTTTPIYGAQLEGAAGDVKNVYKANAGNVQGISDQLTGMIPGMLERYNQGDAAVNASRDYVTQTLGGDGSNPFLDQMISQSNDEVQNRLGASMRKMGLGPAGSSYQGVVGKELGKNALGMRYNDWNNAQGRKMQAAGMSPSLAAADVIGISPLLATAQLGANLPMDNATKYAASTAGLLGPYTNQVEKKDGNILGSLLGALSLGIKI